MSVVYLAVFIGGLLLAVRVMIAGVERPRTEHPLGERSFRLTEPVIVSFAVTFGVVGYILARRQVASAGTQFFVSAALGIVASVLSARAVQRWWTVTPEHEVDDERYILQGHLARVTKTIDSGVDGEVAFELDQQQRVLPARAMDGSVLAAGSDVVIDRIEDDVAYVESWLEVEKRL
jgi:membrane protein implicated in regulation of membrane protease activity